MKIKLLGILFLFGIMGTASAATYTETHTANQYLGSFQAYNFSFDLNDDGFTLGSEYITSAIVDISIFDNEADLFWDLSTFEIGIAIVGGNVTLPTEVNTQIYSIGVGITALATLTTSGILQMTIASLGGDFIFSGATLTAQASSYPAAVPAPSALLLMGSGLIGIATAARRKAKA